MLSVVHAQSVVQASRPVLQCQLKQRGYFSWESSGRHDTADASCCDLRLKLHTARWRESFEDDQCRGILACNVRGIVIVEETTFMRNELNTTQQTVSGECREHVIVDRALQ